MIKIYFSLILLFFLTSCTSEFEVFEDVTLEYAKSDEIITLTERADLVEKIKLFSEDRKFRIFFTDDSFEEEKLLNYFRKKGFKYETADPPTAAKDTHVNVYIENSGSMNGYVNGSTEFKAAIQDLLVLLKYEYNEENLQIFFINADIHPTGIARDLAGFTSALNAKSFKVGNTAGSNLNSIFNKVLAKTSKDTMSILISDCIYSIQGSKTQELLSDQKSLTKDAFLTKSKTEKLATTIVKLSSAFNGNYYDMNNKPTLLNNQQRPYYITIIGSESGMSRFNSEFELNETTLSGYQNKLILLPAEINKNSMYFSVANATTDSGRYKPIKSLSDARSIRGIEDIELSGRSDKPFTFSIAIQLDGVPVENSYLLDKSNYTVTGGNFEVASVQPFHRNLLTPQSVNRIAKSSSEPTHLITLIASSKKHTDVNIALKKRIPEWVFITSTNDDSNREAIDQKTFGLKYLIEGIFEAYQKQSPSQNYFEIPIKINQ